MSTSGKNTSGTSGSPSTSAVDRASWMKCLAVKAAEGRPAFSIMIMSRTSHDVHDPQSALLPTTASTSLAISGHVLGGRLPGGTPDGPGVLFESHTWEAAREFSGQVAQSDVPAGLLIPVEPNGLALQGVQPPGGLHLTSLDLRNGI